MYMSWGSSMETYIRLANIVLTENGSHLIDFDPARKEGQATYPDGYSQMYERHHFAKPLWPMKKEHYRFALAKVMEHVTVAQEHAQAAKEVIEKVKASIVTLNDITQELLELNF